jgi:hypothetical protein
MQRRRDPPPELAEDEPRYLTIVHPYPLNANLDISADRRALALWLACCTGNKDVLYAMFHKPSVSFRSLTILAIGLIRLQSPGMVIIEVDREFDRFSDLLGRHSWSKMLLEPTKEELGKSSEVFYCTLDTGSSVKKMGEFCSGGGAAVTHLWSGWKRIWIEERWFSGWKPDNL